MNDNMNMSMNMSMNTLPQSNDSLSSQSSGGSGKARPFGRRTRLSYCQSTPAISLRRGGSSGSGKMARRGSASSAGNSPAGNAGLFSSAGLRRGGRACSRNPRAPARDRTTRRGGAGSSRNANEEWGEIPQAMPPLAVPANDGGASEEGQLQLDMALDGTRPKKSRMAAGLADTKAPPAERTALQDSSDSSPRQGRSLFASLAGVLKPSSSRRSSQLEEEAMGSKSGQAPLKSTGDDAPAAPSKILPTVTPPAKGVRFAAVEDIISYDQTPRDLKNSWDAFHIPLRLRNFERIAHHRGMAVCYPLTLESQWQKGQECMIRIEPSPLVGQMLKIREGHREAVFREQDRQRSQGIRDAEALGRVAREGSERGVEIASSSWWLKRYDYR